MTPATLPCFDSFVSRRHCDLLEPILRDHGVLLFLSLHPVFIGRQRGIVKCVGIPVTVDLVIVLDNVCLYLPSCSLILLLVLLLLLAFLVE